MKVRSRKNGLGKTSKHCAFQHGAYTSLSVREGKASALSFAGCRARLRAILAETSAARIGRESLIGLRAGDRLPLRAFRNDDEGLLPLPASPRCTP